MALVTTATNYITANVFFNWVDESVFIVIYFRILIWWFGVTALFILVRLNQVTVPKVIKSSSLCQR